MQTLFKKLQYHFLVESTNIDNKTVLYKTALSQFLVITRFGTFPGKGSGYYGKSDSMSIWRLLTLISLDFDEIWYGSLFHKEMNAC